MNAVLREVREEGSRISATGVGKEACDRVLKHRACSSLLGRDHVKDVRLRMIKWMRHALPAIDYCPLKKQCDCRSLRSPVSFSYAVSPERRPCSMEIPTQGLTPAKLSAEQGLASGRTPSQLKRLSKKLLKSPFDYK